MRQHLAPGVDLLDRWVAEGVITTEQAARMRADLGPAARPRDRSLAIEALAYLGSALMVVAALLLASEYWSSLTTAGHLVLLGLTAGVLVLGGLAVPDRLGAVGVRLRAVLWLAACAVTAGFLGVLGDEALGWYGQDLALLVFAGTTVLAALLWWRSPTILQQAALVAGLCGTAGSAGLGDHLPGVAVWGVGAVWFLLGWVGLVRPRWTASLLGGIALLIGAGLTTPTSGGIVLGLATAAALVVIAVRSHDLVVLGLGGWGALQFVPIAVNQWFPGQLAVAIALLVVGAVLVTAALWVARRRAHTGGAQLKGEPDEPGDE